MRSVIATLFLAIGLVMANPTLAQAFREPFQSVTRTNFDGGGAVSRQFHLNAESYFRSAPVNCGSLVRQLPVAHSPRLASARVQHRLGETTFADYVAADPLIDGVIVLHRGAIVFEAYPHMQARQRHYAWSVTKVIIGTALAALAGQGKVDMAAPVERYVKDLEGTAWSGTAVRDIAHMSSGIDCLDSDGYQNRTTCIYQMEESLGITAPTGRNPEFITQLRTMQRLRPAGEQFEYVSANTNVLGLIIENVMQLPLNEAVHTLVWSRIGAEADALLSVNERGYAYASGGMSARLRDVARFGQVYTAPELSGVLSAGQVGDMLKQGVVLRQADLGKPAAASVPGRPARAAWQWDAIWDDGAMFKAGYLGQGLYVDPPRDLVVAWFGTGLDFSALENEMLSVTRQLVPTDVLAPGTGASP